MNGTGSTLHEASAFTTTPSAAVQSSHYVDVHLNVTAAADDVDHVDDDDAQCRLFRFVFIGVLVSSVCVLGLLGNTFSLLVYHRDRSSATASLLLQSIAGADNCFLLLWLLHYSLRELLVFYQLDTHYISLLRMYTFPMLYMAQMLTIYLTVVIALNRFVAVCWPYRAPTLCTLTNCYRQIAFVVVVSIVYNLPRFFELRSDGDRGVVRTRLGRNDTYRWIYTDVMYYCFTFVVPLITLSVASSCVIYRYRQIHRRRASMTSRRRGGGTANDNNITLVMILVVGVFMVCQAPARLVQMIFSYKFSHCRQLQFYLIHVSNSLEVLNSSVNFIIYVTFRRRFARILVSNFCTPLLTRRGQLAYSTRSITTEGMALTEYGPYASERRATQGNCLADVNDVLINSDPTDKNHSTVETTVGNGEAVSADAGERCGRIDEPTHHEHDDKHVSRDHDRVSHDKSHLLTKL